MKKFRKYLIKTDPFDPDVLTNLLWTLEINGITEEENSIIVYLDENSPENSKTITDLLNSMKENNQINSFFMSEDLIEDKNWNEEFERNTNVVEINERIAIKPTFKKFNPKQGQLVIQIDPKMSFGTGEHETTKLVLTLLEKYVPKNGKVLDVGSGTGVLAIASVLLGADFAFGVDNDEWCLLNGNENVQLNKVEDKVKIILGTISDIEENNFDLVIANINKHILMGLDKDISLKISETGKLILSGLLNKDENDILEIYSNAGFKLIEKLQMNEWIALVFKK